MRLILVLKSVKGETVPPLYEICRGRRRGSVYLITELYDMTLDTLITCSSPLSLVVESSRIDI